MLNTQNIKAAAETVLSFMSLRLLCQLQSIQHIITKCSQGYDPSVFVYCHITYDNCLAFAFVVLLAIQHKHICLHLQTSPASSVGTQEASLSASVRFELSS